MSCENCEVQHEEVIIHHQIEPYAKGWQGTARVMGLVTIAGQEYSVDRVIRLRFRRIRRKGGEPCA